MESLKNLLHSKKLRDSMKSQKHGKLALIDTLVEADPEMM